METTKSANYQPRNMECLSMIVSAVAPKVSFGNSNQKTVKSSPHRTMGTVAMNSAADAKASTPSMLRRMFLIGAAAVASIFGFTSCDPTGMDDPDIKPIITDTTKVALTDEQKIGEVFEYITATGEKTMMDTTAVDRAEGYAGKGAYKFKTKEGKNYNYKRYDMAGNGRIDGSGPSIFYVGDDGFVRIHNYLISNGDTLDLGIDKFVKDGNSMKKIVEGVLESTYTPDKATGVVMEQVSNSPAKRVLKNLIKVPLKL